MQMHGKSDVGSRGCRNLQNCFCDLGVGNDQWDTGLQSHLEEAIWRKFTLQLPLCSGLNHDPLKEKSTWNL
jgi:hypothetical protein